ncbi:hypothetical protein E8D37_11000 [Nocardioides sp. GY 10127]|nr:hypothetical protein E8D37_11000 [Nocardioides sp. GY 10127]
MKASSDGDAQLLAVLNSPESSTSLEFPVGDSDTTLTENEDGSVSVTRPVTLDDGTTVPVNVGEILAPWSVDANGAPVATNYSIRGNTLVQHIYPSSDTAYPIVADPSVKVTLFGVYIHWSQSDALKIAKATSAGLAAAAATLCEGITATVGTVVCVAAVAAVWTFIDDLTQAAVKSAYSEGLRLTTRVAPFTYTYWEKA